MSSEVLIALIGVGGTALSPLIAGYVEGRRAERAYVREERVKKQEAVQSAGDAFTEARVKLDAVLLTSGDHQLDSVTLFIPLQRNADRLALTFGGEHEVTLAYRAALEEWQHAVNAAVSGVQGNEDKIVAARNEAFVQMQLVYAHAATALTPPGGSAEPARRRLRK